MHRPIPAQKVVPAKQDALERMLWGTVEASMEKRVAVFRPRNRGGHVTAILREAKAGIGPGRIDLRLGGEPLAIVRGAQQPPQIPLAVATQEKPVFALSEEQHYAGRIGVGSRARIREHIGVRAALAWHRDT